MKFKLKQLLFPILHRKAYVRKKLIDKAISQSSHFKEVNGALKAGLTSIIYNEIQKEVTKTIHTADSVFVETVYVDEGMCEYDRLKTYSSLIEQIVTKFNNASLIELAVSSFPDEDETSVSLLIKSLLTYIEVDAAMRGNTVGYHYKLLMTRICISVIRQIFELRSVIGVQPMSSSNEQLYRMVYTTLPDSGDYKNMRLEIIQQMVSCGTLMKTSNRLTTDGLKVCTLSSNVYETIDVVSDTIGYDMSVVLIKDQLTKLKSLASHNVVETETAGYLLQVVVNKAALDIGKYTYRGVGNVILTNPRGVAKIEEGFFEFEKLDEDYSLIIRKAAVAGTYDVYVTDLIDDNEDGTTPLIIGYKGKSTGIDTGYIFAPYLLIAPVEEFDPIPMETSISFAYRTTDTSSESDDLKDKSKNYYSIINVK